VKKYINIFWLPTWAIYRNLLLLKKNCFKFWLLVFINWLHLQKTFLKKTQNFLSNAKFCTRTKGLISLSYLPTHASSWNLDNGTHSIITYGSSIVVLLIFMSCEKFKLWVSPPNPSKLQIIVHIELEEHLKGQMMKQMFEMSFENAIMQLHWQIFVWILWHYVVLM
jgi:hypothetical protein